MTRKKKESAREKYDKQKEQNRERQRRRRAKLSAEELEKKKQYDRDRYKKMKEEKKIKTINEMTDREKRRKRKQWKKYNRTRKEKKDRLASALLNTPPGTPEPEMVSPRQEESRQKKAGRKAKKKDKAKVYRVVNKQKQRILDLEKKLRKYKKRLEREKKKSKQTSSPSPRKQVAALVTPRTSPQIRKQLFLGFALKKQLEKSVEKTASTTKGKQLIRKAIGNEVLKKYRIQKHFKKIVPYKANLMLSKSGSPLEFSRKKKEGVTNQFSNQLLNFFEDDSVSRMCAGKKDFVRQGKTKVQRRILLDTLQNLHKRFEEETMCKISYKSFARSRPFWVTFPKKSDRDTCACAKHANMELLITALSKVKLIKERNINDVINEVVCSPKKEKCMFNQCTICKDKKVKFSIENDFKVKYFKWMDIKEEKVIKQQTRIIKKTVKVKVVKRATVVKDIFETELIGFKRHLYCAIHQASKLKRKIKNLSENELLFRVDFAENYVCKYATEVQSIHFGASKRQLSLHTGVRYSSKKTDSFCTVSDHLDHQAHAVWAHLQPVLKKSALEFPKTEAIHFFSDSPSSQYRNRINIHLFKTMIPQIFPNVSTMTWNFTESGHGKGPMDGIGGSLKREADIKVLHGCDIKNASEFIEAHASSKVDLLEISTTDIDLMKKKVANLKIPVIKGIMKSHQITNSPGGEMFANSLTCFDCSQQEPCKHYHLFKVLAEKNQTCPLKRKLNVDEVFSTSDEDSSVPFMTGNVPSTSTCVLDVPSRSEENQYTEDSSADISKIDLGAFLLVKLENVSKSSKNSQSFVAISQSRVTNDEFEVMFMKSCDKTRNLFIPDENDMSVVHTNQVLRILPQPSIVMKGNRIFYKFKKVPF